MAGTHEMPMFGLPQGAPTQLHKFNPSLPQVRILGELVLGYTEVVAIWLASLDDAVPYHFSLVTLVTKSDHK